MPPSRAVSARYRTTAARSRLHASAAALRRLPPDLATASTPVTRGAERLAARQPCLARHGSVSP